MTVENDAQQALALYNGFGGADVSGLGDKAKWIASVQMLQVLIGNKVVEVNAVLASVSDDQQLQDINKTLAEAALGRIPN